MTPPFFYVDSVAVDADRVTLDGAEGQHAVRVRRLRVGEEVRLGDGAGRWADGVVAEVTGRSLVAAVHRVQSVDRPSPRITVVQALPKGDRATLAVELLTEVGADAIVPWSAQRCVSRWEGTERAGKGAARWRAVAREAAKQSRRPWLPDVAELAATTAVDERIASAALAVVLHEAASTPLATVEVPADGEVVVVVGPEGGLTDGEVAGFGAAGAVSVRLGPEVLRTSSAGIAAVAVLSAGSSRWS